MMFIFGWASHAFCLVYKRKGDDVHLWVGLPRVLLGLQNRGDVGLYSYLGLRCLFVDLRPKVR